jgi:hypothetical protein
MRSAITRSLKTCLFSFGRHWMHFVQQVVLAAVAAVFATSAYAIDVSNYSTDTRVANVYVSGSTAANIVLEQEFIHPTAAGISAVCDATAGPIDVYSDTVDTRNPLAQLFIYCAPISSLGIAGNVALFKESTLGSVNGSKPLIAIAKGGANTLPFVNANTLQDLNCDPGVAGVLPGAQPYTFHANCVFPIEVPKVVITGGISDVEAPLVGTTATDATKYLNRAPGRAVVWAVPVNLPFYRALQTAQGLANTDVAATVPSLTHAQLAAIYSQQITDPAQIVGASDAPIKAPGSILGICRRETGSATEAAAELQWLGEGCGVSDLVIPAGDNVNVFEVMSTGRMGACLTALDQGGFVSGVRLPAAGRFAIGMASSENGPALWGPGPQLPSGAPTDVRVIAVDGALPTLENVVNGSYPFFSEGVLYNISSALYTGHPKQVWDFVKQTFSAHGFLSNSNKAFVNYWGQSGNLTPPTLDPSSQATIPATFASVQSSPINALTKSPNGVVNNCDPAVVSGASNTATYQFLNH